MMRPGPTLSIWSITNDNLKMLFAYVSAVLVQEYAIYAKHSGIPEIKTVLGGFVIRRFLGIWTLITKSLGLVSLSTAVEHDWLLTHP
jgi:ABC-type proline/glycine betaine transport system permease subunit